MSFNGNGRDLAEIAKIMSLPSRQELSLQCHHDDMAEIVSAIRWPPDPGTAPILGQSLYDTYRHYFGDELATPPPNVKDAYEVSNWRDCYMTAELWKKWKRGDLGS